MSDVAKIAAGLTKAQREMVLQDDGIYQHNSKDVFALIAAGIWATSPGPLYDAVRTYLENQP